MNIVHQERNKFGLVKFVNISFKDDTKIWTEWQNMRDHKLRITLPKVLEISMSTMWDLPLKSRNLFYERVIAVKDLPGNVFFSKSILLSWISLQIS